MPPARQSQKDLIFSYFEANPDRDIPTAEVVDFATREWRRKTGKSLRDPDRAIRTLYSEKKLKKMGTGLYRYDPEAVLLSIGDSYDSEDFTDEQKREILEAGQFKCAICGITEEEGGTLHIDHIRAKHRGGKALVENGQVLCSQHNNLKKDYSQSETGKRFFFILRKTALDLEDKKMLDFAEAVLAVYDEYGMDKHITKG